MLILLSQSNNFNTALPDPINLIKSNLPHQSDSDYQDNSNMSALSVYSDMMKKIHCHKSYISMMKDSDSNDQSYQEIDFTHQQ